MSHEKGIEAAITAALIEDIIPIDGMEGVRIDDYLKYNASDAVELGVKLGLGEDGNPKWHGYSDIRNDEYDDCNRAILRPVIYAAIKAYLDASGMVMVPRILTNEMLGAWIRADMDMRMDRGKGISVSGGYTEMIAAAPNPFTSKSNDEPISAMQLKYEGRL